MAELSETEAALIGKALGDPTRLGIYTQIADQKEICCGDLNACELISGATVSHHLSVLTRSGLVTSRRDGQHILYRAIPKRLAEYRRYLSAFGKKSERTKAARS